MVAVCVCVAGYIFNFIRRKSIQHHSYVTHLRYFNQIWQKSS